MVDKLACLLVLHLAEAMVSTSAVKLDKPTVDLKELKLVDWLGNYLVL